jgi:hypothetical protein
LETTTDAQKIKTDNERKPDLKFKKLPAQDYKKKNYSRVIIIRIADPQNCVYTADGYIRFVYWFVVWFPPPAYSLVR